MAKSSANEVSELRSIGAVAREVDLTPRAIRYYEEMGLLRPAVSVKGSGRLFNDSDVQRLREIKRLREVIGFSLHDISELLDTDDVRAQLRSRFQGTENADERTNVIRQAIGLSERRLAIVERKLALVESVRVEEQQRLDRLFRMLSGESIGVSGPGDGRESG